MNYHILNGGMLHLSPIIITRILKYSDLTNNDGIESHYFYITNYGEIIGQKKNIIEIYDPIFEKFGVDNNFKYINNSIEMIYLLLTMDLSKSLLFIHGTIRLFKYPIIFMLFFLLRSNSFLSKISFIAWSEGEFSYTRNKYIVPLAKKIYSDYFKKIRYLLTISDDDFLLAKSIHQEANVERCSYLRELDEHTINKNNSELLIIVSHSGWQHNNHILSFKQLEHLKNENIRIVCPLCYGDKKYIKTVISEGKRIFNNKFSYFTELKSLKEYTELLTKAHVYISSASLQTGLYAINTSMLGGAYVFLSGNLLNSYKKDGFIVRETLEISELKYCDLININLNILNLNNAIMKKEVNHNIQIWKNLYC